MKKKEIENINSKAVELYYFYTKKYGSMSKEENHYFEELFKAIKEADDFTPNIELFKIGTKIRIAYAGYGASGCNGCKAVVLDDKRINPDNVHGLMPSDAGFYVRITVAPYKDQIWKVHYKGTHDTEYEVIE